MPTCTCIYYSWSIQMSMWKVSVYGDCLPLSHLSHHRRLDSPAPKYNQSWCPDEHVGSIVYGDYPPPDALLALSQHRWQPVPTPPPLPPPPTKYLSSNQSRCIARLAKSPSTRDNNALCVLLFTAQIDFFFCSWVLLRNGRGDGRYWGIIIIIIISLG